MKFCLLEAGIHLDEWLKFIRSIVGVVLSLKVLDKSSPGADEAINSQQNEKKVIVNLSKGYNKIKHSPKEVANRQQINEEITVCKTKMI